MVVDDAAQRLTEAKQRGVLSSFLMTRMDQQVSWAGISFRRLHHRDGRMLRKPGLFAFVRNDPGQEPLMLMVDQAEDLAQVAGPSRPLWADALALGLNELHVHFPAPRRIDRLQLVSRIVRHVQPLLNIVDDVLPPRALPTARGRRA